MEIARTEAPGGNLADELEAAGLSRAVAWRPRGFVVFPDVDPADAATVAKVTAVLAAHTPAVPDPPPLSLEERIAALEARLPESGG